MGQSLNKVTKGGRGPIYGLPSSWEYSPKGKYKIKPFKPLCLDDEDALKFFVFTLNSYLKLIDNNGTLKQEVALPKGTNLEGLRLQESDMPKPASHLKRTIISLLHKDRDNISRLRYQPTLINPDSIKEKECVELYLDSMERINRGYEKAASDFGLPYKRIGIYLLAKMINAVCKGKEGVYVSREIKDSYRTGILHDEYKNIDIERENIEILSKLI